MRFTNKIRCLWEAAAILNNAAAGITELDRGGQDLSDACRADLRRLSQIQAEAVQGLSETLLRRYFKPLTSGRSCTAEYLACLHDGPFDETLEQVAARYDRMTLAQRLAEADTDGEELEDLADFTDYLMTLELDDGARWQILTAMLHPQVHKEPMFDLLRHVLEKLDRHGPELEEIFARRRAELVAWDRENPIVELLRKPSGYVLQEEVMPQQITVLLFEPSNFRGRIWDRGRKQWFLVGAFLPHFYEPQPGRKLEKQDIVNYGKVFSDSSKLEILGLLSQRCYINRELAQALDLSTATISHHMAVLTQMGLVHTTISANRILYDLDREKLAQVSGGIAAYLDTLAKT